MKQYLSDKGIPWKISYKILDEENEEEDEFPHGQGTNNIGNIIADLFKKSLAGGKTGDKGSQPTPPKKPEDKPSPPKRKAADLPALKDIEINSLEPTESWTPPESSSSGGGGPYYWTPSDQSDEEWERAIGRRGEEIIYKNELKRVTDLGYPKSRVVWVANENPGSDFDILSINSDGEDIFLEVKSTSGKDGRFRWPKSEFKKAIQERGKYVIWRVYEAQTKKPSVKPFIDPIGILLKRGMRLDINNFNAVIEPKQI